MDNPNQYQITSDFASSGNDNSVTLTVNVPNHSIPTGNDSVYTTVISAPSDYQGKQIRAQITTSFSGSKNVPSPYVMIVIPVTTIAGPGQLYGFVDITRNSPDTVQLRVRCANGIFPSQTISVSAFSVTARVRTVVVN